MEEKGEYVTIKPNILVGLGTINIKNMSCNKK